MHGMYIPDFKTPLLLLLLLPYAAMVFWYYFRRHHLREAAVAISSRRVMRERKSIRVRTYRYLPALRFLAIFLLIVALARPGRGVHYSSVKHLGIDIMIALDLSDSMMGEDFQPRNRLEVAKQVVRDFIARRASDRIGLVVFSGDAYLQCPLTVDHAVLADIIDEVDFDTVREDGTAIGDALSLAASRMMDLKGKSKIILLLTDGMNNRGIIDPETAAKACAEMGIRVYAVGIGKDGLVPYPATARFLGGQRFMKNHFDETGLKEIARITGGKFYRAASSGVLWENIRDIDALERTEAEAKVYYEFFDKFQALLIIAVALFFLEILLRSVFYRKVP